MDLHKLRFSVSFDGMSKNTEGLFMEKQEQRANPFRLGGIGLLLLLAGTMLPVWLAEPTGEGRQGWLVLGRLVFFAGLGLVATAAIVWYQQAQAPEEPEQEQDAGSDADRDDKFADV